MSEEIRQKIIAKLGEISLASGQSVVEENLVSAIIVKKDEVGFSLDLPANITHEEGTKLREACEQAALSVDGINRATVVLTATSASRVQETEVIKRSRETKAAVQPPTPKKLSGVKKIIAVASGKGGVGKSTVAANLACYLAKQGLRVGLVDADIQGPSVAKLMGSANTTPKSANQKMVPVEKHGVHCLSMGMLLAEDEAAIWRGPMISKALHQMLSGAVWDNIDYLIIDFPPGTGDIHLSLAQNVAIDGAILVSTPQEVALLDVKKAATMFDKVNIPVIGVVNNMAYFQATPEDEPIYLFGKSSIKDWAAEMGMPFIADIPVTPDLAKASDQGTPYVLSMDDAAEDIWQRIALAVQAEPKPAGKTLQN